MIWDPNWWFYGQLMFQFLKHSPKFYSRSFGIQIGARKVPVAKVKIGSEHFFLSEPVGCVSLPN